MSHSATNFPIWLLCLLLVLPEAAQAQAPRRILETTQTPTTLDHSNPRWAGDVCGGKTAFTPGGARYEWTPVVPGFGQYGSVEGISGWALHPHISEADVPFTHPFGKVDFDYRILPDTLFNALLAPKNSVIIEDENDKDGQAVDAESKALGLTIGLGLISVEQDVGLIPAAFRPRIGMGDRVAVFGRWIIDCGHDNWQAEIHPPLLTVVARSDDAHQMTHADFVSNPYLVDQEFEHGGILDQLMYELALVNSPLPFIPFTDRVWAQPGFLPSTQRTEVVSFRLRAPGPPPSAQHKLYFRMQVTARSGVVVQPFQADDETVGVIGVFTDGLTMLPITGSHNWDVTGDELTGLHELAGMAWNAMLSQIGAGMGDFIKAAVLAQGIRGILYDIAPAPDLSKVPVTQGWAANNPWGQNPVNVNNNQPYPVIGWMEVQWRIPPSILAGSNLAGGWVEVDRHLDEIQHSSGPAGAVQRLRSIASLINTVAPHDVSGDSLGGRWRYRIQGAPGLRGESGILWLRISGSTVQGAIEGREKRFDMLQGELVEGMRVLKVVRTTVRGAAQQMVLTRQAGRLTGNIVGTSRTVELIR